MRIRAQTSRLAAIAASVAGSITYHLCKLVGLPESGGSPAAPVVPWGCPCRKPYPAWQSIENRTMIVRNEGSLQAHWLDGCRLIRSRVMLEAEIWTLRQQINVLRRTEKLSFCAVDRMIFVGLYRLFPKICDELGRGE